MGELYLLTQVIRVNIPKFNSKKIQLKNLQNSVPKKMQFKNWQRTFPQKDIVEANRHEKMLNTTNHQRNAN